MSSQLLRLFAILSFAIAATNSLRTTVFERRILGEKQDLRLCVTRQIELDKCNDLKQVLLDNKFDYRLECCLNTVDVCVQKIRDGKCDFMVLEYQDELMARNFGLKPYLFEEYSKDSLIVAVADDDITMDDIRMRQLNFDIDDIRTVRAALLFNRIRQGVNVRNTCERNDDDFVRTQFDDYQQYFNDLFYRQKMNLVRDRYDDRSIRFLRSNHMKDYDLKGKVLICPDLKVRGLEFYEKCNFDTGSVRTIYGRNLDDDRMYLINALKQIVNIFKGKSRSNVVLNEYDQLRLFGQYNGLRNILFDDDAVGFSMLRKFRNGIDELRLNELFCLFDQNQDQRQQFDDDLRVRRDFNILRDPEYYQQLYDLDRYRQYMMQKHYNPYFDYYRYRQYFIDNRLNRNVETDNGDVEQNYDFDRVRRQIYDTDRDYRLYNLDRYQQLFNVDRSRQLPAADRFREVVGLDQYRKQYSYPDNSRQYLDINQDRQITDLNRDRQILDDDRIRQYQYYDRFNNLDRDRQMLDVDRNREILNDDLTRQYQNLNRFYNLDRDRQLVDADRTYRTNPYVDRFRQIVDSNRENQQYYDKDIMYRQNNYNDFNRQLLDTDRTYRTNPYVDRFRSILDVNRGYQQYYDKDLMYRQNSDNDFNRQLLDTDRTYRTNPYVDRIRPILDVNRGNQQYYDKNVMYRQNYDNDVNLRKYFVDDRYDIYRQNLNDLSYRQNMDMVRDRVDLNVDRTNLDVNKERKETKKDRKVLDDKHSRQ